jgi:hypothetical protein
VVLKVVHYIYRDIAKPAVGKPLTHRVRPVTNDNGELVDSCFMGAKDHMFQQRLTM